MSTTSGSRVRVSTLALEFGLAAALFLAYKLGRVLTHGQEYVAIQNARVVHRVENLLWLPSEAAIQGAIRSEAIFQVANAYYTYLHFPLITVFLLWGLLRRPLAQYRWARNLWMLQTGAALVLHIGFPLAPPRMFPRWGFEDTMAQYGPSPYDGASGVLANQFAAMPSLHVGWAVLIAYVVLTTGPRWLGILTTIHAALTLVIVVITANHWWVDAFAGIALLVAADAFLRVIGRGPAAREVDSPEIAESHTR